MNENIGLTKILKDCPKGKKFYSTIFGTVEFDKIDKEDPSYPIVFITIYDGRCSVTADGRKHKQFNGECTLFPSKNQRDWNKFTAPWYKKEGFDPKTLKEFDRVLGWNPGTCKWECNLFSNINDCAEFKFKCFGVSYKYCIPYNDDTKHIVGTKEEAPEYYRYWED